MVWEVSLALIAAAVIALTIYLIITLRYVNSLIRVLHKEVAEIHEKAIPLLDEGTLFLKNNQDISKELNRKLVMVDPLFSLIGGLSTKANLALNARKTEKHCECPNCQYHHPEFETDFQEEEPESRSLELGEIIYSAINLYRKLKGGSYGKK